MKTNLIHCANESCINLVWHNEAIDGELFEQKGLFCLDCAHSHGHFAAGDIIILEHLLEEAGLWTRPRTQTVMTISQELARAAAVHQYLDLGLQ